MKDLSTIKSLSEKELFGEIGKHISLDKFGKKSNKQESLGRNWYHSNYEKIKELICSNEKIRKDIQNQSFEDEIIYLIADTLSQVFIGFPVVHLSVLVVRAGISNLCGWSKL